MTKQEFDWQPFSGMYLFKQTKTNLVLLDLQACKIFRLKTKEKSNKPLNNIY